MTNIFDNNINTILDFQNLLVRDTLGAPLCQVDQLTLLLITKTASFLNIKPSLISLDVIKDNDQNYVDKETALI